MVKKMLREQLYEAGSKSSFLAKVGELMDFFFPDGPECYSLSAKSKYPAKEMKTISEETKKHMKCKYLYLFTSTCLIIHFFILLLRVILCHVHCSYPKKIARVFSCHNS